MSYLKNKVKAWVLIPTVALLWIALIVVMLNVELERGIDDSAVPLLGKWEVYDSGPGWQTIEFLETGRFIIDDLPRTRGTSVQVWRLEDSDILILHHNSIVSNRLPFYVSDNGDVLVLTYPARNIYFNRVR